MNRIARAAAHLLSDIQRFSALVIRLPLRGYQAEALRPIVDSVLHGRGREFLLVFPRQSGKNEAVAQLLVYLLNLYQRRGGQIVYGATGDGLGLGIERLEARLENAWNAGRWVRRVRPDRRCLGRACVAFLSTHPQAATRGHTAHHLLVIDETQDQAAAHIEAVFTPMRAANNATALYIGTVKLTTDYLWQKKRELEAEQARDGCRRVFLVTPEQVTAENPAYRLFLDAQVARHGRHHPIVASEYFLEPIDGSGALFDARRRALMRGTHPRLSGPCQSEAPGEPLPLYVATLDLAGEDEAATDPVAQLRNPARDYTVATVFQVHFPRPGAYAPGPAYHAVDVFVDHGSKHFSPDGEADPSGQEPPAALVHRLLAWLEHWQVAHLVADQSGVGLGVVSWLRAALGEARVSGFVFSPPAKAALGSHFLALVETGRFRYWAEAPAPGAEEGEGLPLSDGWWFWRQVEACTYELPPDGLFDRDLRWGVPASHRTDTPAGPRPTHDDRLMSAALVAELDRLYRAGKLPLGRGHSALIAPADPLQGEVY